MYLCIFGHHSGSTLQWTVCCRRLADALKGGVGSMATMYAVQALHHLSVQLPTCRDLILASTALDTLVLLLDHSLAHAHYSMLKVNNSFMLCKTGLPGAGSLTVHVHQDQ